MRKRFRLPSPAMTVACIALAVALSGASYAAVALPRNSVGTPQLKKNAVTAAKVKSNAITGAKVNEATLGQVPAAATAGNAQNAATLDNLDSTVFARSASEGWTTASLLNTGSCGWIAADAAYDAPSFYKDPLGVVHLRGLIRATDSGCTLDDHRMFVLPAGYRPTKRKIFATISNNALSRVDIHPDGLVSHGGSSANAMVWLSLEGIEFRAE